MQNDTFSGYMSHKYVMYGHFSLKTNAFSFNVILLKIINGKNNRRFLGSEHYLNLLGYVSTMAFHFTTQLWSQIKITLRLHLTILILTLVSMEIMDRRETIGTDG